MYKTALRPVQEEQSKLWKHYKKNKPHPENIDNFKDCGFYSVWNVKKKLWETSDKYGVIYVLNSLLL